MNINLSEGRLELNAHNEHFFNGKDASKALASKVPAKCLSKDDITAEKCSSNVLSVSNKLQIIFNREIQALAEEPILLKEAVMEWKEKKGHALEEWKYGNACIKKCEYTSRAVILLAQVIFNAVLKTRDAKKIDVQDDQAWKNCTIDLATLYKKVEEPAVRLYALNIWGHSFDMPDGRQLPFPGHTLTILQTISKDGKPTFKVMQSYVDHYTLKSFLEENPHQSSLSLDEMKAFVQAWGKIVHSKETWTKEAVLAWQQIAHVDSKAWKGGHKKGFGTSIQCLELPKIDFEDQLSQTVVHRINKALAKFKVRLKKMQIARIALQGEYTPSSAL